MRTPSTSTPVLEPAPRGLNTPTPVAAATPGFASLRSRLVQAERLQPRGSKVPVQSTGRAAAETLELPQARPELLTPSRPPVVRDPVSVATDAQVASRAKLRGAAPIRPAVVAVDGGSPVEQRVVPAGEAPLAQSGVPTTVDPLPEGVDSAALAEASAIPSVDSNGRESSDRSVEVSAEKTLKAAPTPPIGVHVRGAPGGEPLASSFHPFSVGGEAEIASPGELRGEKGGFSVAASVGGRDADIREPSNPPTLRGTDARTDLAVAAPGAGASADGGFQDGGGTGAEQHADGKQASGDVEREAAPAPPSDPSLIVAEADDTRVEIRVRADGVDLRLDTTELGQFDGLEDDVRNALRQGDSELLNYEARDRAEADHQRGERSKNAASKDRDERRGRSTRDDAEEPDPTAGPATRVGRGSIIDVVA